MKNRIYTLTLTDTMNYGALLQAYALREYIISLGNECTVINYKNPALRYSQVKGWRKIRSIVWRNTAGRFLASKKRRVQAELFKSQYIRIGEKQYFSNNELSELNDSSDTFIVGSDQVWSETVNAGDSAFLLEFATKKKIAYAASFGSNNVRASYLTENSKFFSSFNNISVREESGAKILKNILEIDATVVVDPVFLLNRWEWRQKLGLIESKERYVLCYVMPGDDIVVKKIYEIASQIAEELSSKIVVVGDKEYLRERGKITRDKDCGPREFVEYIMNASYVITNSFHGTAFSIIFQKDFYTIMRSGENGRNTRMLSLLKIANLESRILLPNDYWVKGGAIEYSKSNLLLNEQIQKSKAFLLKSIY